MPQSCNQDVTSSVYRAAKQPILICCKTGLSLAAPDVLYNNFPVSTLSIPIKFCTPVKRPLQRNVRWYEEMFWERRTRGVYRIDYEVLARRELHTIQNLS